ncbi:MAG: HPP family protein, partial [Brevundimonas sp.]
MISRIEAALRRGTPIRFGDVWRAGLGGLLGIAVTGALARMFMGGDALAEPLLVAPLGASAVLLFAVPASPLTQPRAVIGGSILSALVGVTCAMFVPEPLLAASLAVAVSIALMSLLGCLHPPGGAVALTAVIGGASVTDLGYGFAFVPVGLGAVLLVASAVVFNTLVGRSYPHRVKPPASPHATADPVPDERIGYRPADLDKALAQYGELLDVSREDLDALFRQVELQTHKRIHSQILCGEIMSRDVITLDAHQSA